MLGASAGFIFNHTCVELASQEIFIAEIVVVRSIIALPIVGIIGLHQGAFNGVGLSVRPDTMTLLGSAILLATSLYALHRERKAKGSAEVGRRMPSAYPPPP